MDFKINDLLEWANDKEILSQINRKEKEFAIIKMEIDMKVIGEME